MLRTKFSARFISVVALVALCLLSIVVVAQLGSLPAAAGNLRAQYQAQADTRIVFASNRDGGDMDIFVMNADGSNVQQLTTNSVVDDHPVWSPDHTKIAFASQRDADWEIYTINSDGSNPTPLTTTPGTDFLPSWSPDGSKIAFVSERDGNLEIYTMNANGTNQTRRTNNAAFDEQPTWHPDGVTITFTSTRDGDNEIFNVNPDNSVTQLTTNSGFTDYRPMWSPAGDKLAFATNRDGDFEIYVMNANGSNPLRLTNAAGDDFRPTWSANGSQLVFFSNRSGNNEIYKMNADGSNPVNLTNHIANDNNADWMPAVVIPPTATSTSTATATPTQTATQTSTPTATSTATNTPESTATTTATPTTTPTATATTIAEVCGGTYLATTDTVVDQTQPDTNFGNNIQLRIAKAGANQVATLLSFDLSTLPTGTSLQKAWLELTLADTQTVIPYTIAISDTATWDEAAITWTTQPASGLGYGESNYNAATGVVQIDITTLATRWINGEVTPSSVRLQPGTGTDYDARFVSREGASSTEQAPKLLIMCGEPVVEIPSAPPVAPDEQAAALAQLEVESTTPITIYMDNETINFASFAVPVPAEVVSGTVDQAQWFLDQYNDLLGVKNGDVFQMIRQSEDGRTIFFRQRSNGIPIVGAEIALHTEDRTITGFNGNYVPAINLPTLPELTAARAEALALANSIGDGITGDTQLRYVDLALLGVENGTTHLTWQVNMMRTVDQAKVETIYVDAFSGEVVFREPVNFESFDLDLENGRGDYADNLCDIWDDADIDWNDFLPDSETATNNARTIYYFWRNTFGRESYDHDDAQIELNINVQYRPATPGGPNTVNASYSSGCDIFFFSLGTATLDIMGHEFTHAVVANEAELKYANQSGALNESFADIFGYLAKPQPSNFLIGENNAFAGNPVTPFRGSTVCPTVRAARDMGNPPCYGQPDHMNATISGSNTGLTTPTNDPKTSNDFGGVHNDSGIHNKVASLIIAGGTFNNYTILGGIGNFKAGWLFNGMLNNRLTSGSQFIDARNAAIAEATDLANKGKYGFTQGDVCTVRKAYAAVGIGFGDRDCNGVDDNTQPGLDVDKDSIPDATDLCPNLFNPGQFDLDTDGIGDGCDPDLDGDGRNNVPQQDNCPYIANAGQEDFNGDGEGDACGDADEDGKIDNLDNCREIANPGQENLDFDSRGDVCDPDMDNDSTTNEFDNCPVTYNFLQEDTTEKNIGLTADGVGDACDLCPYTSGADNRDPDKDGMGNACDANDDNDKWIDSLDNCPNDPNDDQLDWDNNKIGYACDPIERIQFGLVIKGYNNKYVELNPNFRIPVPICPNCTDYLPNLWETRLDLVLPVQFKASVINSTGNLVTKSRIGGVQQIIKFNPAPFAVRQLIALPASVQNVDDAQMTDAMRELAAKQEAVETADEMNYYVRLDPIPGTDLEQTYPLDIAFAEEVELPKLFLPLMHR